MIGTLCSEKSRSKLTESRMKPSIPAFISVLCSSNMVHFLVKSTPLVMYCLHERIHCSFLLFIFWQRVFWSQLQGKLRLWFIWAELLLSIRGSKGEVSGSVLKKNAVQRSFPQDIYSSVLKQIVSNGRMKIKLPEHFFFPGRHKELDTQKTCKW